MSPLISRSHFQSRFETFCGGIFSRKTRSTLKSSGLYLRSTLKLFTLNCTKDTRIARNLFTGKIGIVCHYLCVPNHSARPEQIYTAGAAEITEYAPDKGKQYIRQRRPPKRIKMSRQNMYYRSPLRQP